MATPHDAFSPSASSERESGRAERPTGHAQPTGSPPSKQRNGGAPKTRVCIRSLTACCELVLCAVGRAEGGTPYPIFCSRVSDALEITAVDLLRVRSPSSKHHITLHIVEATLRTGDT